MLKIQSLESALKEIDLNTINQIFKKFSCKRDEDVEKFLNMYSIEYEENGVARTFLLMDKDNPTSIIGYFSLGVNVYKFNRSLKIDDAYQGINLYEDNYRPIYKLFLIGKNDFYLNNINMKCIYKKYVLSYIRNVNKFVGINFMYLDCTPSLRKYYQNLGFHYFGKDEKNKLIRMITKI